MPHFKSGSNDKEIWTIDDVQVMKIYVSDKYIRSAVLLFLILTLYMAKNFTKSGI